MVGLSGGPRRLTIPARLVVPPPEAAEAILRAVPPGAARPAWWSGSLRMRDVHLAVVPGAVSLNTQVLPLLEAGAAEHATSLAILAPLFDHEALATLLINDLRRVFPGGLFPLAAAVPEFHVGEVLDAICETLGARPWSGRRGDVQLCALSSLESEGETTVLVPVASLRTTLARLVRRRS